MKLLRHVYNKFRLTLNNQVGYFWLKQADYARAGADPEESEGLIDHIRAIEGHRCGHDGGNGAQISLG